MRHGHYTVGGTVYTNKLDALLASTQSGQQVHWHWHDVYNHINWSTDSELSVREIYRQRALQLREKYDWIILSFSGGSDSWTVLHSFLSNNIHIDEIFCRWPLKATENLFTPNAQDKRPENILSEWDYAIKPVLAHLHTHYPQIKITVHDWSNDLIQTEFNDDFWSQTQDHLNPGFSLKYNAIGRSETISIDKGRSTCIIFGIDKPQICVQGNGVYCYFIDILANCRAMDRPGRSVELFYWTADMPAVTHTQARAIYRYLCQNPSLGPLVKWGATVAPEQKQIWDQMVRSIVYPDYNAGTFQAKKSSNTIFSPFDSWMWILPDKKFMHSWSNVFNNLVASIDSKFFNFSNGKHNNLGGFITPFYYLGDLPMIDTARKTAVDY